MAWQVVISGLEITLAAAAYGGSINGVFSRKMA